MTSILPKKRGRKPKNEIELKNEESSSVTLGKAVHQEQVNQSSKGLVVQTIHQNQASKRRRLDLQVGRLLTEKEQKLNNGQKIHSNSQNATTVATSAQGLTKPGVTALKDQESTNESKSPTPCLKEECKASEPVEAKKRGRKAGKGKELQDLLEQFKNIQSQNGAPNISSTIKQGNVNSDKNRKKDSVDQDLNTKLSEDSNNMSRRPKRNISPVKYKTADCLMSTEEERLIKLAIKNSLLEVQNSTSTLDEIEEMKTYYPTKEEFQNPINYIEKLYKIGASKYGCIKIVPPKDFKPILAFDCLSERKLPTRYQILQDLAQGKPFNQNQEGHTFAELVKISRQLEKEEDARDYSKVEKEYWNYVDNQVGPKITVEYAADLATNVFGSGFGREGQPIFDHRVRGYLNHPWNLNNMPKQPNSFMQFTKPKNISGINVPWLYLGMKYSTFCWHYEDLMLYSINYNHWGKPKLWYGVPEDQRDKFEKAVKSKIAVLFKKDPNILMDIITMISPAYLLQQKVKVYKTLQMPGEYVLTFPGAYHAGFSTGLNIGEAVNFVSSSWFDYGLKCQEIYRKTREKIPVFPIEWLVIENIQNLDKIKLDLEARLKLKEVFQKILKDEKRARDQAEKTVKLALESMPGKKNGSQAWELMAQRDKVAEDAHQCFYCTDFAYTSMIQCKKHKIHYCLHHQFMCGCSPADVENGSPVVTIVYRFTTKELDKMERKIVDSCQEYGRNEDSDTVEGMYDD